jgi:flagellar biosynthesis GTPase FlhF
MNMIGKVKRRRSENDQREIRRGGYKGERRAVVRRKTPASCSSDKQVANEWGHHKKTSKRAESQRLAARRGQARREEQDHEEYKYDLDETKRANKKTITKSKNDKDDQHKDHEEAIAISSNTMTTKTITKRTTGNSRIIIEKPKKKTWLMPWGS